MQRALTLLLVCVFVFSDLSAFLKQPFTFLIPEAEAAQVTIDSTVEGAVTSHMPAGPQTVFISDQVGYKFYRDGSGECAYSKTTDGGGSWGAAVLVDDQGTGTDCIGIAVWYDRWTPGDTTGNYIHIATFDTGTDDVFYNRVDTANSDTRLLGATAVAASAQGNTNVAGANTVSITKGTDGTIYIAQDEASDSFVVECTTNCNLTASWSETGTRPQDLANDYSVLVPLLGGNIMLINRDISADDIRTKIWNNTSWSASWTVIDANATDNTTYDVGMSATVDDSGNVYLSYTAGNATLGGGDDEVRTALYNGSWATRTDVLPNSTRGVTGTAISRDENTGNIYVAYTARTTAGTATTGNVYWKMSTDNMNTWGAENGPINTSADDMYGIDMNLTNTQRLFASWVDGTDDDLFGDTIADLVPGVIVSANGTQSATINAPAANTHIGGSFVVTEYVSSRDVTSVTLTENGTIDGSTEVENIKLYYENDTTAPYNCASETYNGTEIQFGSTDANGFSGADGISTFTGSSVQVTTTSALCFYVVLDVKDSVNSGDTLNVVIANPSTDLSVTNSGEVAPDTTVDISGASTILNDAPTQTHFHFRNDNGSETTATSRTGGAEDTNLTALQINTPVRLRIGVSNEGGIATPAIQYRLEYSLATTTCDLATGWTDVGASSDDIDMSPSANLTEGANTTNISVASGGVTDENTTFLTTNGGVRDISSQTGGITLGTTNHVDLEYSIVATVNATEGNTYCFRVTDAGTPLFAYTNYARLNIAADTSVTVSGSQTSTTNIPATNFHIGGTFVITENVGSRNVTSITIAENGTVNGTTGLDNIRIYYDLDTSAPYNCASESYAGTEAQFGSTDTDGFSGADGVSIFTGSVGISTTATMCAYVVLDVTSAALNGETINVFISNPSLDVVTSGGGTVSPTATRDITGETTLQGAILTQTHYHWRNDNGSETTATSQTGGTQDTPVVNVAQNTPVRLRMQVSNEGTVTSGDTALRLEYGTKVTTCDNVSSWIDVGALGGAWDMYATANLTEGGNTTNISNATGGVTDENTTFKTPNSAVKESSSQVATTTFTSTQFLEAEFSVRQTLNAAFGATYCFRLSNAGSALNVYSIYPELTTAFERDFEIQRGSVTVSGTGVTLTAGVDYIAPASLSNAFVRITNSHYTGAGDNSSGGTQNADGVTAYISNPENLLTSFTITRPATAISNTRVSWEIVEFIGTAGSDNEMIVRDQGVATYTTTGTTITGGSVSGIADDNDVVVFITGQFSPDTGTADYNTVQSTAEWLSGSDQPQFTRGEASGDAVRVGYAVVEFTGVNWKVQRAEHTYTAAGTTETEAITAVNSLSRTFVHAQKRVGTNLPGTDEFGHEVWLSSIGAVSFFLESGATTPSGQTSVAWIIENTQTSNGAMLVTRSDGTTTGGSEPLPLSVSIGTTLEDITNASIFASTRGAGTGTLYPHPIAAFSIISTTNYELWRSDTGAALNYRVEVVEWPTAGLSFRQNDYRFYTNFNTGSSSGPWYNASWPYRIPVTIDSAEVPSSVTNFPVRLDLSDLGSSFFSNVTSDGGDIRITASDGISELSREVVSINTGGQAGELYFKADALSASADTTFYVYYGNALADDYAVTDTYGAQDVWSNNYVAVYHLQEDPSAGAPQYVDSTGNSSGTAVGMDGTNQVSGVAGNAAEVDGSTENIQTNFSQSLLDSTWSIYLNADGVQDACDGAMFSRGTNISGINVGACGATNEIGYHWNDLATTYNWADGPVYPTDQWFMATLVVQPTQATAYVHQTSGVTSGSNVITHASSNINNLDFGWDSFGAAWSFDGSIDEVRLSSVARTADWLAAEYTSVAEPDTFYSAGSPEAYSAVTAVPADPWPAGITDLGENTVITAGDEPLGDGETIRIRMSLSVLNATMPELSKSFKLQYGERVTSCSAISEGSWFDVGDIDSSAIWRGYDSTELADGMALSIDPPNPGDLVIAVSDVAGTFEEQNPSVVNPYTAEEGDDVEYDWLIQQNGATAETYYCFRMIESNDTVFSSYLDYPTLVTSSFTPRTQNWRFYEDEENATPASALANENVAPVDIADNDAIKLRVTVEEVENIARENARFKLQYSEYINFSTVYDVVATSSCTVTSTWCYFDGGGSDNEVITTTLLSDADSCVAGVGDGCGTRNESSLPLLGYRHENGAAAEYEFTITAKAPRANAVYYFRLYDLTQDLPVSTNDGETYPSLVIEGASLVFNVSGLTSGTVIDGETLDVNSQPGAIAFGSLPFGTDYVGGYRLSIQTNATEGFQILMYADQLLQNEYGSPIAPISGTNASPVSWGTGCSLSAIGCVGYHAEDDTLSGLNSSRFAPNDTYAALSTDPEEVMYSSIPFNGSHDIVYKLRVTEEQPAGLYEAAINFLAVPVY